ncbi:hypothetical protein C0416_01405 [bacterium]|nr:hypothetical protein [bacterium]
MRMFNFTKSLFLASLFVVFTFVLTGCFGPAKAELSKNEKSNDGVALENYLPEDTLMMISLSTQDDDQRASFQNLMSYFPQEDMKTLWESMMKDLTLELEGSGMTYEEDIAPIFGDSYRFTFGLAGEMSDEDPDMYIALTLADKEKATAFIEKMLEEDNGEDLKKGNIFGAMTVDNEDEDMYLALYKDTILITNVLENREAALKRVSKNESSLLSSEIFKESYDKLPTPNLGIAFINLKELFAKLSETQEEGMPSGEFLDALYGEALAFTAEEDGIRMTVQVAFNEESKEFNLKDYPYAEPYMYKNIPGDKLIMYTEAYGMKDAFDMQLAALGEDEASKDGVEQFKAILKAALNLDLEDDILSWMDKGFVMVVQHNKGIIPAISFYIDAQTNPDSAQKVLDLIDAGMEQAVASMLVNAPEELDTTKIIIKDTVMLGDSEIDRVVFDVSNLSDEELLTAGLPSGIFVEPVEIYYGMTDEKYFLFSTYTGLDKDYGTTVTVAKNEKIKESQNYLKGYEYQLTYISVEEIMNYVDTFVGFMELIEGPMGDEVKTGLEKVKSYVAPIKYLVAGDKKVENVAEGTMFVKIEKPVEKSSEYL